MIRKVLHRIITEAPDGGDRNGGAVANIVMNLCKLFGVMLLALALTQALNAGGVGSESLLMVYFLAVLTVSVITPKYVYGILSALVATFAFDFFLVEPFGFSFGLRFPIALVTMLIVTAMTSTLTMLFKHQTDIAHKRERRADLLFELSQAVSEARDVASVAQVIVNYLSACCEYPAILYVTDPKNASGEVSATAYTGVPSKTGDTNISDMSVGGVNINGVTASASYSTSATTGASYSANATAASGESAIFHSDRERARVHRFFVSGAFDTLEADEDMAVRYEPIIWGGKVLGLIGVHVGDRPISQWNLDLIILVTRLAAHALELQQARDVQNDLRVGAEREKMRSNLLRSISHDLRTPLTSIMGASTAILEQGDISVETRDNLLRDIQDNTRWLIRMVENILTVTRISQESVHLNKSLEAAEEVMSQSVSIVRARFPDCLIHVKIPSELVMVPMDATLISQVIINLLENAVKSSNEGALVLFTLKLKDRYAHFEVSDRGCGIPGHILDNLFEIHTNDEVAADASMGFGIGLSICRTIVLAHGGVIEGHNREKGGAKFSFMLPLDDTSANNNE